MLVPAEIKELSKTSPARTLLAIGFDWAACAGLFWLGAHAPHPLLLVPLVVLMGRQQLALAILMHEASHKRLFKSVALNDWAAQWLVSAPVYFSLLTYRRTHMQHHQAPLAPDDPDLRLTGGYPISRSSLARKLLRDLFGISYFKFLWHFISHGRKPRAPKGERPAGPGAGRISSVPGWVVGVSVAVVNGSLLALLIALGHGWLFLWLWMVPFMTSLQVLLRIRGITEHAGYAVSEDQRLNSRTVVNPVQVFFFAPHHVNFHIEHHAYPSIPWFNLPKAHRLMKERGSLPDGHLYSSYAQVMAEVVR